MLNNAKFEPETPLERAALRAIRTARWFADGWRKCPIEVDGLRQTQVARTLERLDEGDLFQVQDEPIFEMLERTLVKHLNQMRDGYGTYALQKDTCYDQLFCPDLERGRRLMEQWKSFKQARQHIIDFNRARTIAERFD